jgi:sodium pump decarboxylase gamma subunit
MAIGEIFRVALIDTILGMGTVFVVLIFISLIISCFGPVSKAIENFFNKGKTEETFSNEIPEAARPPVIEEEDEELVDDLELVAVITAAIAAYDEVGTDGFVVRSIKRSNRNKRS